MKILPITTRCAIYEAGLQWCAYENRVMDSTGSSLYSTARRKLFVSMTWDVVRTIVRYMKGGPAEEILEAPVIGMTDIKWMDLEYN